MKRLGECSPLKRRQKDVIKGMQRASERFLAVHRFPFYTQEGGAVTADES